MITFILIVSLMNDSNGGVTSQKIEITSPYEKTAEKACETAGEKWRTEMAAFDTTAKYVCIKPY